MKNLNEMELNEVKERFGVSITGNLLTRKTDRDVNTVTVAFSKLANLNMLNKEYTTDLEKAMDYGRTSMDLNKELLKDLHTLNLGSFTFRQGNLVTEFIQKYSNIYPVNIILGHIHNTINSKLGREENEDRKVILNNMTEENTVILVESNDLDVQTQIDYNKGHEKLKELVDNHLSKIKLTANDSNHTYIATQNGRTFRRFYKGDYDTCSEILLLFIFYKVLYSNYQLDISEIPVIRKVEEDYEVYLPITNIHVTGYNLKNEKDKPEAIGFTAMHLSLKYYTLLDLIKRDINQFLMFYIIGFPIFDDIEEFKKSVEKLITKDNNYIDSFIDFYENLKEEGKKANGRQN